MEIPHGDEVELACWSVLTAPSTTFWHSFGIAESGKLCFGFAPGDGGCSTVSLSQEFKLVAASVSRRGRRLRLAFRAVGWTSDSDVKMLVVPHQGRTFANQDLSDPASRHMAVLIAGFTKMRVTAGSCAAARTTSVRSWVHTSGSTSRRSFATMFKRHIELALLW